MSINNYNDYDVVIINTGRFAFCSIGILILLIIAGSKIYSSINRTKETEKKIKEIEQKNEEIIEQKNQKYEKINEPEIKKILIDPEGEKIQETRTVDGCIEALDISGDARVMIDIKKSNTPSFKITACKNIISLITTKIINNCLSISQGNYSFKGEVPLEYTIYLKKLNAIKISDNVHICSVFQEHYKDAADYNKKEDRLVIDNCLMNDPLKRDLNHYSLEREIHKLFISKRYNLTLPSLKIVMKDKSLLCQQRQRTFDLARDTELSLFDKSSVCIGLEGVFKSTVKAYNNSVARIYDSSLVKIEARNDSIIELDGCDKVAGDQYDTSIIDCYGNDSTNQLDSSYNVIDHRSISNRLNDY